MSFESAYEGKPENVKETMLHLRKMILKTDKRIEENVGGNKIKTVLYSIDNPNQVLYGLQSGSDFSKLFLHFTDKAAIKGLKLEGAGKHAKHVKIKEWDDTIAAKVQDALNAVLHASGY